MGDNKIQPLPKLKGTIINCTISKIECLISNNEYDKLYPYLVSNRESKTKAIVASPNHGRSIIVGYNKKKNRYIVTKGNGLTYFPYTFINTGEKANHVWGFLDRKSAIRDFITCNQVREMGISTNHMEAVFTLDDEKVYASDFFDVSNPTILQYNVKCPYRISDMPLLPNYLLKKYISEWGSLVVEKYDDLHCIAADILIRNISILHRNGVLHNAIDIHNYTLSLELLDFELCRTPSYPYDKQEDENMQNILYAREVVHSLEIINYIACFFKEIINNDTLTQIMEEYGYKSFLGINK